MPRKPKRAEYRFRIEAYTPETMPMARLADYLAELAAILGETNAVHLVRVEGGSTTLVHAVEIEAVPKVRARARAVKRGEAPRDALRAYEKVNQLLREDNARATLRERGTRGPRILEFPGKDEAEEVYPTVSEFGSIQGEVHRVGGSGDRVPVLIETEDGQVVSGCYATRPVAKELAHRLFEPVRLHGQAYWLRGAEGRWSLKYFRVEAFEPLEDVSLSSALGELRSLAAEWEDDAFEQLIQMRQGVSDDPS